MLELLFNRRSIRKFTGEPVSRETLTQLVRAAMYAPSARNCQPWQFIVLDTPEAIEGFAQLHHSAAVIRQAAAVVIVCGDSALEAAPGYFYEDCGAATQNLLLAAASEGLGTCWLGLTPGSQLQQNVKQHFALPAHVVPFCGVAIGHPDETRTVPERYDEARVHWNDWA